MNLWNLLTRNPPPNSLNVGVLEADTLGGVDQTDLVKKIGEHIDKHQLNIFVGPEFLFERESPYTENEKNQIIQSLIEYSKGKNVLIVPGTIMWEGEDKIYNTAPVIANGKLLGEYNKQTAPHETRKGRALGLGGQYEGFPSMYKWNNMNVGVEICSDAAEDNLQLKSYLDKHQMEYPDLYILPACGYVLSGFEPKQMIFDIISHPPIKEGGYGINSDGYYNLGTVTQRQGGKYQGSMGKKHDDLKVFQIDIPTKPKPLPQNYNFGINSLLKPNNSR